MQICSLLKWGSNSSNFSGPQKRKVRQDKIPFHPCMNEEAHYLIPRLHLPVAPLCNIHCRFCNRKISSTETGTRCPGVANKILTPQQALKKTGQFFKLNGNCSIVGIAGPGDSLANRETFQTFKLVREAFPDAGFCLCTNGLNLPCSIKMLRELKVKHLSVTINGVLPEIVSKITPWVKLNGRIIKGEGGARILIKNQLAGISAAVSHDMFVKINTVVVPRINGFHVEKIAETAKRLGAGMFNPMPLIQEGNWKKEDLPSQNYMTDLQNRCELYLPVFKKCCQCRADAEGIPGKEICL